MDGSPGDAGFARILDAIVVAIIPDAIADLDGGCLAEGNQIAYSEGSLKRGKLNCDIFSPSLPSIETLTR